jgi:hypothetical protein
VEGASPPREVPRRRPQTATTAQTRSLSREPAHAKRLAVGRKRLRRRGEHTLVSGDELPPQFCAESHLFRSLVQWILQPQVCVVHGRQGMVRMYSTLTKAPKHAGVVISELLAAHGHQFATVKPTYQQNPSTNVVTLVFNIDEGPRPKGRGIVLKTRIGDAVPVPNL